MHPERHPGGGELGRRTVEQDPAAEDHDSIDVLAHGRQLVGDEQHPGTVLAQQVDDRVAETSLRLRVDPCDRLVQDEQVRLAGERPGDECPLLLTPRQLVHRFARELEQVDGLQGVMHGRAIRAAERAPPPTAGQPARRDDLLDRRRYLGRERRPLRHVAHAPPLAELRGLRPEQPNRSLGGIEGAEQHLQQGGFARAVRADERDELTGTHGE